jgi:hypothetical protein
LRGERQRQGEGKKQGENNRFSKHNLQGESFGADRAIQSCTCGHHTLSMGGENNTLRPEALRCSRDNTRC